MSDARGRRRSGRFRYGEWAGGPDPLAPPYDVRAALDQVGQEVLRGGSLRDALRDLLQRGPDGRSGLEELRARAARMRREASRRGDLDGALTKARAQLDQALAAEREELAGRDGDDARFSEARLDALPRSTAQAVRELEDYPWASPEARAQYQQILEGLRSDVVDQQFRGMRDALEQGGAEAAQAMKDMMSDLNELLEKKAGGQDTPEDFAEFMEKHGEMLGEDAEGVENLDDLVDTLARRAAAAARLMRSLSPQQRAELGELMDQAFGSDADLQAQMAALSDNLRALRPDLDFSRGERVRGAQGSEPLGYGEAADALQDISELDDLLDALGQDHPGATLDDVDVEALERQLGRGAADELSRLRELERELQRQGWLSRSSTGLTLSPKALRRLGQTALRDVLQRVDTRGRGDHENADAGSGGEPTGATRRWEFGDEQPLDVVRTVSNALKRGAAAGTSGAVKLSWEDFEVVETERRAGAAVALCVDLSYSMAAEGRWGPMKETALALSHLIATKFPGDALQIVGFGLHAQQMSLSELAEVEPDFVQGTNLQHALSIARRHLRKHPDAEPVVLVITDGEPTAHLQDAEAVFSWPPTSATIRATVDEVDRLTRFGAKINLFMLGEDAGLRRFVDAIARRNGGRVLTPSPERLGAFVVDDYLKSRTGSRSARRAS
ncbi:vWA domain-containing protein [Kineococcus rubinsiae]|uniref:vWA domain-containing protein n=1 Tax=Kineococcus rubinsiae TaxID=2609562 RepID=UPI00142F458D|nr:VWA domain-containing protein [Kineococcus rubinsiae]NIZ91299.1 VWA domain-containing protein [Kineococcus rubinsiae]